MENRESAKPIIAEAIKQMNAAASGLSKALAGRLDGKLDDSAPAGLGTQYPCANRRISQVVSSLMACCEELTPIAEKGTTI